MAFDEFDTSFCTKMSRPQFWCLRVVMLASIQAEQQSYVRCMRNCCIAEPDVLATVFSRSVCSLSRHRSSSGKIASIFKGRKCFIRH
jgi:hypothetical protein